MRIGHHHLERDEARATLAAYARDYHETVLWYDLAGKPDGRSGPGDAAEPVNEVSLADIGRLVVIAAQLKAQDVPVMLNAAPSNMFAAVPARARLEEWAPGNPLDSAVTLLYDRFRHPGIQRAKRSKLLHMKRPWLIPILDTYVEEVYRSRVADLTEELGDSSAAWWEAPKRDLVDGADDLTRLAASLAADDDALVRRAGNLTPLRLLDILAWTLGRDTRRG